VEQAHADTGTMDDAAVVIAAGGPGRRGSERRQ
jgi:hypothetical protein